MNDFKIPLIAKMLSDVEIGVSIEKDEYVYVIEETKFGNYIISPMMIYNDNIITGYVGNHEITIDIQDIGNDVDSFKMKKFPKKTDYDKYKGLLINYIDTNK